MGPEREVLKDHLDAAMTHGDIIDGDPADEDGSAVGNLQAGDEPEGRRFAAAALAHDHEKLAIHDGEIRFVHGDHRTEAFGEATQDDGNHDTSMLVEQAGKNNLKETPP